MQSTLLLLAAFAVSCHRAPGRDGPCVGDGCLSDVDATDTDETSDSVAVSETDASHTDAADTDGDTDAPTGPAPCPLIVPRVVPTSSFPTWFEGTEENGPGP